MCSVSRVGAQSSTRKLGQALTLGCCAIGDLFLVAMTASQASHVLDREVRSTSGVPRAAVIADIGVPPVPFCADSSISARQMESVMKQASTAAAREHVLYSFKRIVAAPFRWRTGQTCPRHHGRSRCPPPRRPSPPGLRIDGAVVEVDLHPIYRRRPSQSSRPAPHRPMTRQCASDGRFPPYLGRAPSGNGACLVGRHSGRIIPCLAAPGSCPVRSSPHWVNYLILQHH